MVTSWDEVAKKVKTKIETGLTYLSPTKITIIPSVSDYFASNTAQTTVDDIVVLISPTDTGSEGYEPRLSGYFRRKYTFAITVISKIDPNFMTRIWGTDKKGIFEIAQDVANALEHSNLDGFVDNKAGANFEVEWSILPIENRTFTGYQTVYTVTKTEK